MARTKERGPMAEPVPAARYDGDLYSWSLEQAALLRAGRLGEVDAFNIAEELDDVGSEQYDKLESALRVLLRHMLKWDHQPERRSRSWWASIQVQRKHVAKVLRKNPGLKTELETALSEAYDEARTEASGETDVDIDTFPQTCPFTWREIMERPFAWPSAS